MDGPQSKCSGAVLHFAVSGYSLTNKAACNYWIKTEKFSEENSNFLIAQNKGDSGQDSCAEQRARLQNYTCKVKTAKQWIYHDHGGLSTMGSQHSRRQLSLKKYSSRIYYSKIKIIK